MDQGPLRKNDVKETIQSKQEEKKLVKPLRNVPKGKCPRSSYIKSCEESSKFLGKPHIQYREVHVSDKCNRKTVFVGSSELCHLWKRPTYNPVSCVDFDCLIGGTVIEVHKLFLNVYRNIQSPLNIVVSCGINNIPLFSSEQTITQLKCFVYSIKSLHKENKIVFVTVPYAPKFCHLTKTDHTKIVARIKHINDWIEMTLYIFCSCS